MNASPADEKAIFNAARRLNGPDARRAYIEEASGNDDQLRARVEALLRVYDRETGFLESPIVGAIESSGTVIGHYKLIEPIGEGGFGVVYLAEQQQPVRRQVALKVIKPGMDTRHVVARFEAERQALALMEHPNIARVLDGGETAVGRPYFVMELVRGVPITEFCDREHLPVPDRLRLFVTACQAVQHAHQKGIIHRDLKPSNMLVSRPNDASEPVLKVIDFGIAKAMDQQLTDKSISTLFTQILGTPLYMSPEQAAMNNGAARDVDTRSDIYSLGVVLYELLTGYAPFNRDKLESADVDEIRRIIREDEPPLPSTRIHALGNTVRIVSANRQCDSRRLGGLLRGELDWIVMKCLEKDRTRRYDSADALARDIERSLSGEPVEAGPRSTAYKLQTFIRRHRRWLVVSGAFVAVLAAATIVSSWLAVRATLAERSAGEQRDQAIAAKQRGDEEAAVANALNEFVQNDLLGQADIANQPAGVGRDKDVTVHQLLDRAARGIDKKFEHQELTEAAIRFTIGKAYQALGDFAEAQKHLDRALAIYRAKGGNRHPKTLDCMNQVATLYWQRGQNDQAERLYQEVLAAQQALGAGDDPLALGVISNLAMIDANRGRYDEAEAKFQRVTAGMRRKFGEHDPKTLAAMSNLATLYSNRGEFAKSEPLQWQVLEGFRSNPAYGPDHPRTLYYMNNLAAGYLQQKQYAKARPIYEDVLKARLKTLAPGHPDTLSTMNDLAVVYQELRRFDDADGLFQEALSAAQTKPGPDHPLTLKIKNCLGSLRAVQGRYDEAEPLFREVFESRRKTLTADHPDTLISMHNLGHFYRLRGDYDKAEPLLVEAVERARAKLTIRHPYTRQFIENLAVLREKQGKPELAEALRQELAVR
jgi:eukaryotic-like serine/threonine-protein kinase